MRLKEFLYEHKRFAVVVGVLLVTVWGLALAGFVFSGGGEEVTRADGNKTLPEFESVESDLHGETGVTSTRQFLVASTSENPPKSLAMTHTIQYDSQTGRLLETTNSGLTDAYSVEMLNSLDSGGPYSYVESESYTEGQSLLVRETYHEAGVPAGEQSSFFNSSNPCVADNGTVRYESRMADSEPSENALYRNTLEKYFVFNKTQEGDLTRYTPQEGLFVTTFGEHDRMLNVTDVQGGIYLNDQNQPVRSNLSVTVMKYNGVYEWLANGSAQPEDTSPDEVRIEFIVNTDYSSVSVQEPGWTDAARSC